MSDFLSSSDDSKNRFAFRGAAGSEGFTRFTPPAKPSHAKEDDLSNDATTAKAESAAVPLNAATHSQALIKSASGGWLGNLAIVNVAKMAMVGMAAGAVYGLAKNTAETQGVLYELKYKTSAFDMDPFASQLFHKLGRYESLQPESYKLAIHYCDKLFLLERHLASPLSRPSDTDIPLAQSCVDGVFAHVMLMRNHSINGEQRGQLNILKTSIAEMLSDHRSRIYNRCATLRL